MRNLGRFTGHTGFQYSAFRVIGIGETLTCVSFGCHLFLGCELIVVVICAAQFLSVCVVARKRRNVSKFVVRDSAVVEAPACVVTMNHCDSSSGRASPFAAGFAGALTRPVAIRVIRIGATDASLARRAFLHFGQPSSSVVGVARLFCESTYLTEGFPVDRVGLGVREKRPCGSRVFHLGGSPSAFGVYRASTPSGYFVLVRFPSAP